VGAAAPETARAATIGIATLRADPAHIKHACAEPSFPVCAQASSASAGDFREAAYAHQELFTIVSAGGFALAGGEQPHQIY
jgi:hypothetical protein